jgi:hypothetical protein
VAQVSDGSGRTVFDSFDSAAPERLDRRDTGPWILYGGSIEAVRGVARPGRGGGSMMALTDLGSPDVVVDSSVTLSPQRAAPGFALRATDRDNALVVSLVVRSGQNRVSLHAVEGGRYRLLSQANDFGLRLGGTHDVRVRVDGPSVVVVVDGRTAVTHRLSAQDQSRFGDATSHGLRVMRTSVADDGRSSWNHVSLAAG